MSGLGEGAQNFAALLTAKGRPDPVIELWPSQQAAFQKNLLDPYRRAVLVEMPTSSGKTLLAKFSIVQTRALNPNGTVAYLAPTRALVNQVANDLRGDFSALSLTLEQGVSSFELNPAESSLLASRPDILVTTPEKLDLLIKSGHPAVEKLALVIADEAHSVGETGTRGARLELLLGTIKRERANVRFLLLSPFLPNGNELAEWLGDDRSLSIKVNWRPGHRIVGSLTVKGRTVNRATCFTTLASAANVDTPPDIEIPIAPPAETSAIKNVTRVSTKALLQHGSVLILCRGAGTAMTRASELAEDYSESTGSELLNAVCNYLIAEAGVESKLVQCLRRRIAYHHSGLSPEARWLVEKLISQDQVKIVCGTTTLAQGMNFPIRTVIVETAKKGSENLSHQDFWNNFKGV
jgi:replicative superfamily II helicase